MGKPGMISCSTRYMLIALAVAPGPCYAYLDPGTGSMILQGVIAGLAMAAMTIKLYWHKLLSVFGKKKTDDIEKEQELPSPEEPEQP